MDTASLIGVLVGMSCLFIVGYEASHGHWAMFYSLEGVLMVIGGSISVVFMAMPMSRIKNLGGWLKRFMFAGARSPEQSIKTLSELAEKARREERMGFLSLKVASRRNAGNSIPVA